jgi:alpha-ketoglutarate-dependent taurine dioxygenase
VTAPRIEPLGHSFGAEVQGLAPDVPLDPAALALLRRAFDSRGLLLIRDFACDMRFQDYLCQALIGNDDGVEQILAGKVARDFRVSNKEERGGAPFGSLGFHADMIWSEDAFRALSLYGLEVEQPAVPTHFVSMVEACKRLPEALRQRIEGLEVDHGREASEVRRNVDPDRLVASFDRQDFVRMPIIHRHARTGEPTLYVAEQLTHRIAGMDPEASEDLLEELFAHIAQPSEILSHEWRTGDLVVWDNLALQHARPNVRLDGPARTLRKAFGPHMIPGSSSKPQYTRAGESG